LKGDLEILVGSDAGAVAVASRFLVADADLGGDFQILLSSCCQ
jgi:hypothetical protein